MLRTSFLEETDATITPTTRVYCIEHGITAQPTCQRPNCDNPVHWDRAKRQFSHHCCVSCSMLDPKCREQRESTCVKRLGVKNPSQSKVIQEKKNQTCLKNHGVEHPLQSKEIYENMRQRFKERHGVDHPMQLQEAIDKLRESWIKNYGGVGLQSKEMMERLKQHCKETLGVENPSKSDIIKKRKAKTTFNHFGVENPAQSDAVKDKIRKTNLERRGVEWSLQSQEVRDKGLQTMMDKWGHEYSTQVPEIREKIRQTVFNNCGYDYYFQCPDFQKKLHKRYTNPKYPDMTFATSWEFKVYDFLTEHNISFEYQPSISIPYKCEDTQHYYHPDFLVNGRFYEVKGDNFFRINEETGKEEMYLTWKGDLSDEEYEWRCKVMEAKHQCMIANNVIILR